MRHIHLKNIEPYTIVVVQEDQVLEEHHSIVNFPDRFEIVDSEIPEFYQRLDVPNPLETETEKYQQRILDGQRAYSVLSAEFRLAKVTGLITEEEYHTKEEILIPVRNEVLAGQWVSAKKKLIAIGSESIGESLYNRILNQITDYINSNY